ncbi:hypothetical protein [Caballeronia sordidicola]|uniref:hypothetical protein n=1 Tax=Caballeronia sordidicola TaxID=196367 RepID=UPI000B79A16F|nr:hypothetical protein [Caballeronia sordidicola]
MTPFDTVRITLVRAQEDEASFSPNYLHELKQFYHLVRADRTRMSAVAFTMAGVTGDSGFTGEFVVPLNQEIGPVLGRTAVAWLQGRPGRTVRFTMGELNFDISGFCEFDALLAKARAMKRISLKGQLS